MMSSPTRNVLVEIGVVPFLPPSTHDSTNDAKMSDIASFIPPDSPL